MHVLICQKMHVICTVSQAYLGIEAFSSLPLSLSLFLNTVFY